MDIQVKSNFQGLHTHCRISGQSIVQSPRRLQGTLSFIREKTKHSTKDNIQKIEVFITEDLDRIINRSERIPKRPTTFIFDILQPKDLSDLQIYRNINQAVKTIHKYMKRIAENLKLAVTFIN